MKIHLSKPGGEREGPYSLEQINRDLATNKYHDSDYWAWYEGAESWMPLHAVPGIRSGGDTTLLAGVPGPGTPEAAALSPEAETEIISKAEATGLVSQPESTTISATSRIAAGLPFQALEQIFIFTGGDGPALMQSAVAAAMLEKIIGKDLALIREKVARDVFGRCNIAERLKQENKVPASAWRAMSSLKPEIVQQAKEGKYRTCVRTFAIEDEMPVAVFLFYNKAKL